MPMQLKFFFFFFGGGVYKLPAGLPWRPWFQTWRWFPDCWSDRPWSFRFRCRWGSGSFPPCWAQSWWRSPCRSRPRWGLWATCSGSCPKPAQKEWQSVVFQLREGMNATHLHQRQGLNNLKWYNVCTVRTIKNACLLDSNHTGNHELHGLKFQVRLLQIKFGPQWSLFANTQDRNAQHFCKSVNWVILFIMNFECFFESICTNFVPTNEGFKTDEPFEIIHKLISQS